MFHTRHNADITQQLPIVTVLISIHDTSNDEEIHKLEVAMFPLSEERGEESNSSSKMAALTIVAKMRHGCATGRKDSARLPNIPIPGIWNSLIEPALLT